MSAEKFPDAKNGAREAERKIHAFFVVSVLAKGLNGVLEIFGGIVALFVSKAATVRIVEWLARAELVEDPRDAVANYVVRLIHNYTAMTQHFIGAYLLIHGIVKIFLVYGLLRKKLWAYPAAIGVFTLFGMYQIYAYARHPNVSLIILTIIDLAVIVFTCLEYKNIRMIAFSGESKGGEK
jgi:uncharacterized membrane protein